MKSRWTKWRKSFPILRRVVMGLVILPPLVALPKVTPKVSAPQVTEVSKKFVPAAQAPVVAKKKKTNPR